MISLLEMAFASHCGLEINVSNPISELFNEELGCVIQISKKNQSEVINRFKQNGLDSYIKPIAKINNSDEIKIYHNNKLIFTEKRKILHHNWSSTSYEISKLRDNPICSESENNQLLVNSEGLQVQTSFDINESISAPFINSGKKPRVAILREQGINGHIEMAAAFSKAGFDAIDVHMSEILSKKIKLSQFHGMVACGGFSYGDVLGAGRGWANSILFNNQAKDEFREFFNRQDSFSLGVCNGCQMLSNLKEIIPGSENWPTFERNTSEQFEARFTSVKIQKTNSLFFHDMEDSIMPIAIAHGEGKAQFTSKLNNKNIAIKYIDYHGDRSQIYPHNPNGSENAVASVCNDSGRVTLMMPHPERVFRSIQNSWHPKEWGERSPWMRMFENARKWVG